MTDQPKARSTSSPTRDALRLFTRNRPAVIAAVMIFLLTAAAVTGKVFTGKPPTEAEKELIAKAEYLGDKVALERNSWAVMDPLTPVLKDKLKAPLESSDAIEGKVYLLGTDKLGRDILARLWAGSFISLTIGFVAVGISVFLGVLLGGISGYWGRERIQLPFFVLVFAALIGGLALIADFAWLAWPLFAVGLGAIGLIAGVAAAGRRWPALIGLGVVASIFAIVNGYNIYIEHTTPVGESMQQAAVVEGLAYETLIATRDYGYGVKEIEDEVRGHRDEEWRSENQYEVEILYKRLATEKARFDLIERNANIRILERTIEERIARAEMLVEKNRAERAGKERKTVTKEKVQLEKDKAGVAKLEQALEKLSDKLAALQESAPQHLTLQTSNELLDRRAEMRGEYYNKFTAKVGNFKLEGLYDARLLSGHPRYPVYRITSYFITLVVLYLALLIAVLFVVGAAQGAAHEMKSPLKKLFIPTITVDDLVMRFTEVMMTIPVLILILAVLALFKRDVYLVMAVIGLTSWMGTTRFVRAEILSLREQDFVQAAKALGVPDYRIIWRHLIPNAISPVLVSATLGVAGAVLAESTLSFLGIGARPDQPTWGQILSDGRMFITDAWWLTLIPGLAILITVLSFNMLGEGLREAFNPKLRGR